MPDRPVTGHPEPGSFQPALLENFTSASTAVPRVHPGAVLVHTHPRLDS